MSKIEEMAIQFANEMYGEYNTSNIVENGWPKAKSFYEQGAKAVLEEIEKAIRLDDPCDACSAIVGMINELKG